MCIAVVDSGSVLKAFVRMDDDLVGQRGHRREEGEDGLQFWHEIRPVSGSLSQPGGPLYGIAHSNDGLITIPGSVPIVNGDGVLLGAIGVSGSSVENDLAVAMAAAHEIGVSELPEHPWRRCRYLPKSGR